MRRRRQKSSLIIMNDLSLTPLIDTALTLLIIFMVATPMMRHAVRVTLPKGTSQDSSATKEEYIVYVDEKNNIQWNNQSVQINSLIEILKKVFDQSKEKTKNVFIRADTNASWGVVLELFDALRSIKGIEHVVLPIQKSLS